MREDELGRLFSHDLKATGVRPKFAEKLQDHGIKLGAEVFMPEGTGKQALQAMALKR